MYRNGVFILILFLSSGLFAGESKGLSQNKIAYLPEVILERDKERRSWRSHCTTQVMSDAVAAQKRPGPSGNPIFGSLRRCFSVMCHRGHRTFVAPCTDLKSGTPNRQFYSATAPNYANLRKEMVETQIRARGVRDERVLAVMERVERHLFVPEKYRPFAYEDNPLPIGEGQTISQPYIVALMTELLELKGKEKVLEIGTGSGYQAAILSELARKVYTIEILKPLAESAGERLKKLGYKNVLVKCGDGYQGWQEYAPFDGIIVTCAPAYIPQPLVEQLAEGGKMVIPVGEYFQELKLLRKTKGKITEKSIIPVRFVPMTGESLGVVP